MPKPPDWDSRVEDLRRDLEGAAFDEALDPGIKKQLASALTSVIGVKAKRGKASLGESKLGGAPDAEAGFSWPTAKNLWQDGALEPLAFFGQLNLAQMAPHDVSGRLPKEGRVLLFALPIEFDPMAMKTAVHVSSTSGIAAIKPPRALAAEGRFAERALTFFPTVVFPDFENGGFLSFDDDNEQKLKRVLKKHGMAVPDLESLLGPRFSEKPAKFRPKKDVVLLRFMGENMTTKDGDSLWYETEMLFAIDGDALLAGELGKTRLVFGEGT